MLSKASWLRSPFRPIAPVVQRPLVLGSLIYGDALKPDRSCRGNATPTPAKTITVYTYGVRQFRDFLVSHGMPSTVQDIRQEHVEAYISHVLEVSKPWTALTRYRDLQQFFPWQLEQDLIDQSPMHNMRKPSCLRCLV